MSCANFAQIKCKPCEWFDGKYSALYLFVHKRTFFNCLIINMSLFNDLIVLSCRWSAYKHSFNSKTPRNEAIHSSSEKLTRQKKSLFFVMINARASIVTTNWWGTEAITIRYRGKTIHLRDNFWMEKGPWKCSCPLYGSLTAQQTTAILQPYWRSLEQCVSTLFRLTLDKDNGTQFPSRSNWIRHNTKSLFIRLYISSLGDWVK